MKNYTIIALPEKKIEIIIEKLRKDIIDQVLVDHLPPHITFKRRFTLNSNFLEIDLINYFKKLRLKKFRVNFTGEERINDVLALAGVSDEMKYAHISLVNDLKGKITTKNPEWEGNEYIIHMTLIRGQVKDVVIPEIKEVNFNTLALYEIDSEPGRLFANEMETIKLN
jgi:2'-5' RNA ligase